MFKYRIRMFFNELKVLVFMRSDSRPPGPDPDPDPERRPAMRGLGMGGCGWPPFVDCHRRRDDDEEYYGSEPRPRSLAFEDREPKLQVGLDAVSLASTASSMRTPQCRICFQGPEQVHNTTIRVGVSGEREGGGGFGLPVPVLEPAILSSRCR